MFLVTRNNGGSETSEVVHEEFAYDILKTLVHEFELMKDGEFFMIRRADYLDTKHPEMIVSGASTGRTYGHLTVFDGGSKHV